MVCEIMSIIYNKSFVFHIKIDKFLCISGVLGRSIFFSRMRTPVRREGVFLISISEKWQPYLGHKCFFDLVSRVWVNLGLL